MAEVKLEYRLDALDAVRKERESSLRYEWCCNHGCNSIQRYGDDGEMQCHGCYVDFLREPFDSLQEKVKQSRLLAHARELDQ